MSKREHKILKKTRNEDLWEIAFCPWIQFKTEPFSLCGVLVTGFNEISSSLPKRKRTALWRARKPYYDHFLGCRRKLERGNDNPLVFVIEGKSYLASYSDSEINNIFMAHAYLYLMCCCISKVGKNTYSTYTSWTDWELFFPIINNPKWFSLMNRRLFGAIHAGGFSWQGTVFSMPLEANRYELNNIRLDLVDAINRLFAQGKAEKYYHSLKTFGMGTTDKVTWKREEDIPFIKDAIEQITTPLKKTSGFIKSSAKMGSKTGLGKGWINSIRTISQQYPENVMVCTMPFNPKYNSSEERKENKQQKLGKRFSWLERCLDDVKSARNMVTHEGFLSQDKLKWPTISLSYVASKFFILCFKRMLEWEAGFIFKEEDNDEVFAMGYLAKHSRKKLNSGVVAYKRIFQICSATRRRQKLLDFIKLD